MRTLLCFGDSNTHGTTPMTGLEDSQRYAWADRWTGWLATLLPDWQVIEEGHPGRTTVHDDPIEGIHRNGMRVLPALLESHKPIDVVLVMLGTNDLKQRFSINAMDIALSLETVVLFIQASAAGPGGSAPKVVLVAPPPILEVQELGEIFAGGAAKSQALAPRIAAVARRTGAVFVDAGALISVSAIDGIHYDAPVQQVLALAFCKTVKDHFG